MVSVPRAEGPGVVVGVIAQNTEQKVDVATAAPKRSNKAARKLKESGRMPTEELKLGDHYNYRESNTSIGRAAERAGVKVRQFVPGDRFLAWRRRNQRKTLAAEKRAMGRKKGSARKAKRGNTDSSS